MDYKIRVQCTIELDKPSSSCTSEFFYVALDGDKSMANSQYYCGKGTVDSTSQFRKVVLAYTSSSQQSGGRFSCTLSLIAPTPSNCDCGWAIAPKIVGGTETRVNQYPSMVGLIYTGDNGIFCGAVISEYAMFIKFLVLIVSSSIVNHFYLMSAAHCFDNTLYSNAANVLAIVGEHDTKTPAESKYTLIYRVEAIIKHPQYNSNTNLNDIALVKITSTTPIEWSMGVGPACLPYLYRNTDFTNAYLDIVGWGTTSFAGPKSTVLLKATVVADSQSDCVKYYSSLTSNQICTKPQYNSNSDACQYDSGGPVYYVAQRQYSIGIISYGQYCGNQKPAVNTRVTSYLSWIESKTGGGFCQK